VLKSGGGVWIGSQLAAAVDPAPANDKGARFTGKLMCVGQEVREPLFIAEHSGLLGWWQVAERCSL